MSSDASLSGDRLDARRHFFFTLECGRPTAHTCWPSGIIFADAPLMTLYRTRSSEQIEIIKADELPSVWQEGL
jgi:hypothetical protein